jgi:hypothetical protein
MNTVVGFLFSLAVVATAGAGFATIVGPPALRERCFGVAIVAVIAALALPLAGQLLRAAFSTLGHKPRGTSTTAVPSGGTIAFVLGHLVLGVTLVRLRLGNADRARRDGAELEQARGRVRPRLLPGSAEPES